MKNSSDQPVSSGVPLKNAGSRYSRGAKLWQTDEIKSSRPIIANLDVLARISYRVSYQFELWCQRSDGVPHDQKNENLLIKSEQFHLPAKKALQPSDRVTEIVLVDATEQPIERPTPALAGGAREKDNVRITAVKSSVTRRKHR
jgi:hypothetical protein